MADLTDKQAAQSVKIVGADPSTGVESNFAQVDSSGNAAVKSVSEATSAPGAASSFANLIAGQYKTTLPTVTDGQQVAIQVDSKGRLLTASAVVSSLPAASIKVQQSINAGVTSYYSYTASQQLALKQFYAGGTGIGEQVLYAYTASTNQFVSFGDFESSGDVSNWVYTTNGGSGTLAFSTSQQFTGSGSMSLTFTSSDSNHLNGAKQTFSTPQNFSSWRYVSSQFYNTVSAGAAYTRSIAIILTDSASATRTYLVSGLSTSSPFNASGWVQILGEIANPTSFTGSSFDTTSITSIELRQWDSANKAGTVYWDTVKLSGALNNIFPIYHQANSSFNIAIDPVYVLNNGDTILIAQTNNDSTRREYFALAGGVSL